MTCYLAPYSTEEEAQPYFKDDCVFKGEAAYIDAKTDIQEEINKLLGVTTGEQLSGAAQAATTKTNTIPPNMSHLTPKI